MIRRLAVLAALAALAACSSSASTTGSPSQDSGAAGDDGGTSAPTGIKTHVILGDSISDRGGAGPFFYDLLDHNDDTAYPDYKGKDLETKYGSTLNIVKAAKAGSTAAQLVTQAKGLATSLPGPVLVTITIGGNDVKAALASLLVSGSDAPDRMRFQGYLEEALGELTKPGRFGDGVTAKILMTNIYDPSDGTGNFTFANGMSCGQPLSFWNKGATDPYLTPWEDIMKSVAANHPEAVVLDLHARFHGHGVPANPTWFFSDCIHPNTPGHNEVRGLFWDAVSAL